MIAVDRGNDIMVQALVDAGADINYKTYDNVVALYCINYLNLRSKPKEMAIIAEILLKKGADPNYVGSDSWDPLILAAAGSDNFEVIKLLVQFNANVNLYNPDGRTALYSTLNKYNQERSVEVAKFLLNHGADPYIQNNYGSAAEIIRTQSMYKDLRIYLKESEEQN
jgi:ankyrin repeat protein